VDGCVCNSFKSAQRVVQSYELSGSELILGNGLWLHPAGMNVGFASTCFAYVVILSRFKWKELSDRALLRALERPSVKLAAEAAIPGRRTLEESQRNHDIELAPLTGVVVDATDDDNLSESGVEGY
jgi:hypothetical protein